MYPNKPIADTNLTHNSPSLLENPPSIDLITRLPDLQVYRVGVLTNSAFGERAFTIFFSPAGLSFCSRPHVMWVSELFTPTQLFTPFLS